MPLNDSSIDRLITAFKKHDGAAKSNRFEFICTPPVSVADPALVRDMSIFCESVTLPGIQTETLDYDGVIWQTNRRKIAYAFSHGENMLNVTFILSGNMFIHKMFCDWSNLVVDRETNLVKYEDEYKSDASIMVYDQADQLKYQVDLQGIFPITVPDLELNSSTEDILKLPVVIAFERSIIK